MLQLENTCCIRVGRLPRFVALGVGPAAPEVMGGGSPTCENCCASSGRCGGRMEGLHEPHMAVLRWENGRAV